MIAIISCEIAASFLCHFFLIIAGIMSLTHRVVSPIAVNQVSQTNSNRRIFRMVSRATTGETFEPSQTEILFFGKVDNDVIAVGSYEPALPEVTTPTCSTDVDSQYAHCASYMFIKPLYQNRGYGSAILDAMERDMKARLPGRPCRLQSARRAVGFFEKKGYQHVGEPFRPVCPGSPLFSLLFPMEKTLL